MHATPLLPASAGIAQQWSVVPLGGSRPAPSSPFGAAPCNSVSLGAATPTSHCHLHLISSHPTIPSHHPIPHGLSGGGESVPCTAVLPLPAPPALSSAPAPPLLAHWWPLACSGSVHCTAAAAATTTRQTRAKACQQGRWWCHVIPPITLASTAAAQGLGHRKTAGMPGEREREREREGKGMQEERQGEKDRG